MIPENRFKKLRIHNFVTFEDYGVDRMNDLQEQNKVMIMFLRSKGYDCVRDINKDKWTITEYTGGSDVYEKMFEEE